jgi:hypothetical protein
MNLKLDNVEAAAVELAINAAIDSGQCTSDVENLLAGIRGRIEQEIDLKNLATKNMGRYHNYSYRVRYILDDTDKEQWFYTQDAAKQFVKSVKAMDAINVSLKKVEA